MRKLLRALPVFLLLACALATDTFAQPTTGLLPSGSVMGNSSAVTAPPRAATLSALLTLGPLSGPGFHLNLQTTNSSAVGINFKDSGGTTRLVIETSTAGAATYDATSHTIKTNGNNRWAWNSSGHLIPSAGNTFDIGNATDTVRAIYGGTYYGNTYRIESAGPVLEMVETGQSGYRQDYGYWRWIADNNALFLEVWERSSGGTQFDIQDEFLSFHRTPTSEPSIGEHLIQINYPIGGLGARDLWIGANRTQVSPVQSARVFSIKTLDTVGNTMVSAIDFTSTGAINTAAFSSVTTITMLRTTNATSVGTGSIQASGGASFDGNVWSRGLNAKPSTNVAQLHLEQNNSTDGWDFHATSASGNLTIARVGTGAVTALTLATSTGNVTAGGTISLVGTSIVYQSAGVTGTLVWAPGTSNKTITLPNGTTDFTATGGTGQVVKQASLGAAFTVGTVAASEIASGAALTKTDDTNVTLTLGGSPTSALLASTSITVGWTGRLALTRFVQGATNTVLSNATSGTADFAAFAMPSCSTAGSALNWTTNTGFGCNTSITAAAVPVGGITGLGTGVATFLATPSSANLAAAVTDETGTGALAFATGPTFTGATVSGAAFNVGASSFFELTSAGGGSSSQWWIGRGGALGANTTIAMYVPAGNGLEFGVANVPKWIMDQFGSMSIATGAAPAFVLDVGGEIVSSSYVKTGTTTVGSLSTCNSAARGRRHFVTDATATTFASTVAGGGANNMPVVCDGANWIIG